jgi:hypothetical protein
MDFEKELQELIQAALEDGVSNNKISAALQAASAAFADQEDEDDEDEDDGADELTS